MVRLEDIVDTLASYSTSADLDIIKKAYVFSARVHEGQTRISGEPYLSHPLEVAAILTHLKMDSSTIATGLLHDTVEDTRTSVEKIEEVFGPEIAALVDGLTKISRITFDRKEDREAENFRKMILAMAKDIRVVIIKLADRLHNMRTLGALDAARQKKIAQETLDIYAPLAHRLGIGWMKTELEDLAFKYIESEKYGWFEERLTKGRAEREKYISTVKGMLEEKLGEHGIKGEVAGRVKHLYSIYKKMVKEDVEFENIHDILAFRIVVGSVAECYTALGIIHSTWKPVPGRFKDYIAIPKPNLYQSLHTTVVGLEGERMEVQIRTEEMHRIAEYGIAAHWKYKEGKPAGGKDDAGFAWIRQLLEWQKDLTDSFEFLETVKIDLFPEEVFVFTPKGDIRVFPVGATPVDFAYAIHTDVGHRCSGARVNGKMVTLRHRLRNGDVVAIITSPSHAPSKDWLGFAVTSSAKAKIRQWIKTEEREKSLALGKEICEKEFKKYDLEFGRLVKSGDIERIARAELGLQGVDSLLISVGYGKISVLQVLSKIVPPKKLALSQEKGISTIRKVIERFKGAKPKPSGAGVIVKGIDDIMVRFARCCSPLPGDQIDGYIAHGQGVTVHTRGCPGMLGVDRDRRIDVEWDSSSAIARPVRIVVTCRNEKGLLADMSNAIKNADANIAEADIKTTPDKKAVCTFDVEVKNAQHLKGIISSLQKIKKVIKVERVGSERPISEDRKSIRL
ncbi:MAG: bifunctional (p)ppGpp synthetase/guanosine-3',5'-bis(diphosphate) 3'-pyrophosphohydrolase [Deltaproteobacteria bacterium]|nr:bifunctional (p)ppGpp synthetase/guanosine-3',5'-bis(diphosphate) 3'-pyrophosphohydrolase [Deltaproteobacteria bacterium]